MGGKTVTVSSALFAVVLGAVGFVLPALADEERKRGGTLNYMIPADAPPSFDGHREATFATVHSGAPFYSVLIRINPENPSSTTDFVCDLCTKMPQPTDHGKTYTFKIREGVKFHDGSPLTAYDVAASWSKIIHPPEGVTSARESFYVMVDKVEAPDPATVVFHLKFATGAFLPALADPYAWIYKKEVLDRTRTGTRRTFWAPARSSSPVTRPASRSRACAIPTITIRDCLISTASPGSTRTSRRYASTRSAPTVRLWNSVVCRPLPAIS